MSYLKPEDVKKDIKIEFLNSPEHNEFGSGTHVVEYINAVFFFEGSHIIIEEFINNGKEKDPKNEYVKGYTFPLKTIKTYKYKTHVS